MNTQFSLEQLLQATGGKVQSPERTLTTINFDQVTYDSRQVKPGTLFVAMRGEESDGHLYINDAIRRGASVLMVQKNWTSEPGNRQFQGIVDASIPIVEVSDTLDALQDFVRWWRNQFPQLQAIGITGSVGKSSTKELIAAVLSQKFCTFKSPKNINDQQSLMPVLLELSPEHERAVIEMGAGWNLDELTRLCRVVQPVIGVELGVSHSHIGRMQTLERIAEAKSKLVQALPSSGYAVLNGDDVLVRAMAKITPANTFFFGLNPSNDLWADQIKSLGLSGLEFVAHYQGQSRKLKVPFTGRHFVVNLLAACAVGLLNGLNWDEIEAGLQVTDAQIRLIVLPGINGSTIIDDAYNASPVSTVAALDFLEDVTSNIAKNSPGELVRKIAVLGDMLELGNYSREAHEIVGRRAAEVADWLIVYGELGKIIGETALSANFDPGRLIFAETKTQMIEWLKQHLEPRDYVLIKASRGMNFDQVVSQVTKVAENQTLQGKVRT